MVQKNDLCERLIQFAVDLPDCQSERIILAGVIQAGVILYLRTVKNTLETLNNVNI